MKTMISLIAVAALAAQTVSVVAMPLASQPGQVRETAVPIRAMHDRDGPDWRKVPGGYAPRAHANGGYRVNRYGYGNYVPGPAGGFGGYPAGSAGAQIYRQKEEWKCQAVPETC